MLPIKPVDAPLYVVTTISNPWRYLTRYHQYRDFAKYITDAGARLYTVEAAYGDRAFEVTEAGHPQHIQVRTSHELWHKENLINIGVSRLPPDWQYVAWVDADIRFARNDIVTETVHQLQHYAIVQMFSHALDLGPQHEPLDSFTGFVARWVKAQGIAPAQMEEYGVWHPGYAWAARREAWDALGGLLDFAVVGSADRYMACALIGELHQALSEQIQTHCPVYVDWCAEWQQRAQDHVKRNIGFVDGLLTHYFHGAKKNRFYFNRSDILWQNEFDPAKDIKRDWQSLWQLTDRKPRLRDQLREYFKSRSEDQNTL